MIETGLSDKIIDFLKTDLIQNLNILGVIENHDSNKLKFYVDNVDEVKGVLVNKGYYNYIYTKEDGFIADVISKYRNSDKAFAFSGVEESLSLKLRVNFNIDWESCCDLYYLPKENFNIALKKNRTASIEMSDGQEIDEYYTYRSKGSLERIKEDIKNRPSSGVRVNGELVCWVLVHADNSMGIMYTKEEHRGKGYAVDVTVDLCDKILTKKKVPYLQIVKSNTMSPGLAQKCGFVKYGSAIWFGVEPTVK